MILKSLKKILGIFGYKLISKNFIKNQRILSEISYLNIDKLLWFLFEKKKIKNLIQVGANDGLRFDKLNKFIKKYYPLAILVEPIINDFNDLKKNYKGYKNIFFENVAISDNNQIKYLYKIKSDKISLYDDHVRGLNSFEFNHLIKHGVKAQHIEKEEIKSLQIKDLIKKYNLNNLDLLMIDAEGYDARIVSDFIKNTNLRPFIIFEYIHIKNLELKRLVDQLKIKKYNSIMVNENVFCFPEEFNLQSSFYID